MLVDFLFIYSFLLLCLSIKCAVPFSSLTELGLTDHRGLSHFLESFGNELPEENENPGVDNIQNLAFFSAPADTSIINKTGTDLSAWD